MKNIETLTDFEKSKEELIAELQILRSHINQGSFEGGFRTEVEDQTVNSEDYLAIFNNSPLGIFHFDENGIIKACNDKFVEMIGTSREHLIGFNLLLGLREGEFKNQIIAALSGRTGQYEGYYHTLISKKKYYLKFVTSFIRSDDGWITGGTGHIEDLTEQKRIQDDLRESEANYRELFDQANNVIIIFEPENEIILDVNKMACEVYKYSREELLGTSLKQLTKDITKGEMSIRYILENGKLEDLETIHLDREGNEISLLLNSSRITYKGMDAVLSMGRDFTERKKNEVELIKAKEKAQESDRLKTEFLAQISHEIRTPINTILNFIYLLKSDLQDSMTENMDICFKSIDSGSRRLIRTIDLLLNMSQVQTGYTDLKPKETDIEKEILQPLVSDFSYSAESKGIKISFENSIGEDATVKVDHYTTTQIFMNLLENAIKYTPMGEVSVKLYRNHEGRKAVDVADTGIGISNDYLDKIFTPFSQEETGYSRRFEGNGLGLALVKKYCELNNAEIQVRSKKGNGSVFSIHFNE